MTKEEAKKLLQQYEQGGSFDAALLKCVRCADQNNLLNLSAGFPVLVDAHLVFTTGYSLADWKKGII